MDEASGHSTPRSVVNVRGQDSAEKIFNDYLDFEEYIGSEEIESAVLDDDELISCLNKYSRYSVGSYVSDLSPVKQYLLEGYLLQLNKPNFGCEVLNPNTTKQPANLVDLSQTEVPTTNWIEAESVNQKDESDLIKFDESCKPIPDENGIADVRAILLLSKEKIPIVFNFLLGDIIICKFPIKNGGCVPLNLAIRVDGASIADMVIDPSRLCIPPGRESFIKLHFLPKRQQPFEGTLVIEVEPNGKLVHVNVTGIPYTQCSKFPVTTTHKQLVWGSVCVGKQETESCKLRNESNSTVKLQASLADEFNSFQLINDKDLSVNELDIIIHSMESVKFNVAFNPPKIGSAIATVTIKESSSRGSSCVELPLHGYGGHVKVDVKGVSKDITERMWLSMGLLDSANSDMCSEFLLSNTGTLDAFAIIKVIPKGLAVTESDFAIKSPYLVIGAGASVRVKISFHLRREVYEYLSQDKKDVIEIGLLEITTGDEPSRQRIRSMLNRAKNSYQEEELKISHVSQLCKKFPGEVALGELEFLNDPDYHEYNIIRMLNRSFICEEILLTVEKNLDKPYFAKSMMVECGAEGNSRMVTIHPDSTPFTTPNAKNGNNLWNISPSLVILMPPHIVNAGLIITNKFQTIHTFEAEVSNSCLLVVPSTGTIQPNDDVMITVSWSPSFKTRERELQSVIRIYLGNGVKEIKVRIKYVNN